jgi:prevent-host-death family protein
MARERLKLRMKHVSLFVVKDDLSHSLHEAETGEILITRHGKPAGILIGFASEDAWLGYRLQSDPRLAKGMESHRASSRPGREISTKGLKS